MQVSAAVLLLLLLPRLVVALMEVVLMRPLVLVVADLE